MRSKTFFDYLQKIVETTEAQMAKLAVRKPIGYFADAVGLSVTNGVETPISNVQPDLYDNRGMHDPAGLAANYVVPADWEGLMWIMIEGAVLALTGGQTYIEIAIKKNGVDVIRTNFPTTAIGDEQFMVMFPVEVTMGDIITFTLLHDDVAAKTIVTGMFQILALDTYL